MRVKEITSLQNPRVKDAVKLRDHRQRARQGRFVIDGARELLLAIEGGINLTEVFACVPLCKSAESLHVIEQLERLPAQVYHVAPEVFEKLAFGDRHEGVVAVAETPRRSLADLRLEGDSLVVVLEGLEKPGNLGAVLRSADGAGVSAVIAASGGTDLYNPNCIRASLGTIFTAQVCHATTEETLVWLRARGCQIFAARLDARRLYTDVDLRGDVAIVLGSEAAGLSQPWFDADIAPIKLPMLGSADSLNVSASAAVLFYEAWRQRALTQG